MSTPIRIEQFAIDASEEHAVIYHGGGHFELFKKTESVIGEREARGPIVWVALAEPDAVEELGCAIHHVVVDHHVSSVDDIAAIDAAIEQLTIARAQLVRLQQLAE